MLTVSHNEYDYKTLIDLNSRVKPRTGNSFPFFFDK